MTITVVATVMIHTGSQMGCNTPQDSKSPAPAGINMTGIISIRKTAVSLTCSTFTRPDRSAININTKPYTLAGMGSGMSIWSSSPKNVMSKIMLNCLINFTSVPSFNWYYQLNYKVLFENVKKENGIF